jgi:hypothetical protein
MPRPTQYRPISDSLPLSTPRAEFNWIWVTWSSGWSLNDERENRENLKNVVARCHENGIHVSAYLSASNMFRKSVYRDDPETKKYGLWMHGIPMFYAGPTKTDLKMLAASANRRAQARLARLSIEEGGVG